MGEAEAYRAPAGAIPRLQYITCRRDICGQVFVTRSDTCSTAS